MKYQNMNRDELIDRLKSLQAVDIKKATDDKLQKTIHELEVHQIELEMQNRQLQEVQHELEESRNRYADLYDFAPVGYVTLDKKGNMLEINLTAATMIGIERSYLLGTPFVSLVTQSDRKAFQDYLLQCQKASERTISEINLKVKKSNPITVQLLSAPVEDSQLNTTLYRMAITDITARKQADENQRQLEARMRLAQKLESLGVLTGGIAHDFNNMLAVILGSADLALLGLPGESPVQKYISQIVKVTVRATDLTNQMLAYAGKLELRAKLLNLSRLVEDILQLLKTIVSKKAIFKYELEDTIPAIEADAAQLTQVVMNLITNASEALEGKEGIITVRTGVMKTDQEYLSSFYQNSDLPTGRQVYLEVSDTGIGMDKETTGKIFDPFFSTKFIGRGLGMASTLGILQKHNAAIKIDSNLGAGTTIRILFPLAEKTIPETVRESSISDEWRGSGTALVVDDEEDVRFTISAMLEKLGFTVLSAINGEEGVNIFQEHAEEIAFVLLDLTMPRMDGVEAFDKMRQVKPGVRIILSSGYSKEESVKRFAGIPFTDFIKKPYRFEDLMGKVRAIIKE
jgi:PAS domain S-box-containing protein